MRNLYLTKKVLPFLLLLCSMQVWAQTTKVTGRVTSGDDGTGLPGVSILEKGTTNGTVSDAEGNYSLSVSANGVLVFSFVGYATQEVNVAGRTAIDIVLESDVTALGEIVVIGYGQQEKKDVTGVITAVSSEQFNKGAIVAPEQLITGKVAGVQIVNNSGEPGAAAAIRIRGGTSINASNEPLFVIDGVPVDNAGFPGGRNPLNFINPNDIETFTVLKDASASAIYGARAANGVIIITTKKGISGAPKVTYDGFYSVAKVANRLEVLNGQQFRDVVAAKAPGRLGLLASGYDTDWQDQIFQTAKGQSHALTVSGGTEKTSYRTSFSYLQQDGVIKTSATERINFGVALTQKAFNDKLLVELNFKGAQTRDWYNGGGIGGALAFAPTQPIYDANSEWGGYWEWDNDLGTKNPVAENNLTKHNGKAFRGIGNVQLEYKILDGLSAKLNLATDIVNSSRRLFRPSFLRSEYSNNGTVEYEYLTRSNPLLEYYMNYVREIGAEGKLDVMAGYSYQSFDAQRTGSNNRNLNTDIYGYWNPSPAQEVRPYSDIQQSRLISFFGRVNFGYKDKYLLTVNLRRDGSSRFSKDEQWGLFPSAALAWRVIDEPFMASLANTFSDLKLRIGGGVNGNQEIQNYSGEPTFTSGDSFTMYQFGEVFYGTIRPNGYKPLKWEQTTSINAGIDFGLLDGRLTGTLDAYEKVTDDLIFMVGVPAGANLSNRVLDNIGELKNRGIELALDAVVIDKGDFSWNVGFNASINRNKIVRLDGDDDPSFKGYEAGGIAGGVGSNIQILKVGESINTFRVYRHLKDDNGDLRVDYIDYNEDGTLDLADMYADLNGDNVVNDEDRLPYKNANPKLMFGLSSTLKYKKFDFNFTLRANTGNYVYNNVASSSAYYNRVITELVPQNMPTSVLETNFNRQQLFSDYYIEDASFLRMDNITVGYTIPKISNGINARVYATGQNVFVLSDYSGVDPEIGYNNGYSSGIDNNLYPRPRTLVIGVSLGF
jgi:TonB-dependent starch-binding outer membrane protein SusC